MVHHRGIRNSTDRSLKLYDTVLLNDLWMHNLTSGLWSWLSGSQSISQPGIYGTPAVAAAGNVPGARHGHTMVIDGNLGVIVIFGGIGVGSSAALGNLLRSFKRQY